MSLTTEENAKSYIKFLKNAELPFELTCSNYTTKILSPVVDKKFVYSMQTNQCFAAFAKVKKDVKDKTPPEIDKDTLVYFEHDFKETCHIEKVFNIDLKSAYATILYLDGIISEDTFKYLGRLPKHDRLASVGMLAAKKKIFEFNKKGTVVQFEQSISAYENFFYYAVKRTFEIMQGLKAILREKYLFTWVDGIYFHPDMERLIACEDYLREIGFGYSEEILFDWHVRVLKGAVKLSFFKEGKIKAFCLPARESEFARIMAAAMTDLNIQKQNKKQ